MTQVVNQTHISEIIKQNIALTTEILTVLSDVTNTAANILSLVDRFKDTNDKIYGVDGTGGVMGQIVEINNAVIEHNKIRIMPGRDKLIEFHFEEILKIMKYMKKLGKGTLFMKDERIQRASTVINYLKDINDTLNSIKFNPMLSINLELLNKTLGLLNLDTIPIVRNISLKSTIISIKGLNKVTEVIFPFVNNLFDILNQYKFSQLFLLKKKISIFTDVIVSLENVMDELLRFSIRTFWKGLIGNYQFKLIRNIFDNLKNIINFIDDIDIIDTTSRRFELLSKYTTYIFRISHKAVSRLQGEMYNIFNLLSVIAKMHLISVIFKELAMILTYIQDSKTFLLKGKLKIISDNLYNLFDIIDDIISLVTLFTVKDLVVCIGKLFLIKKTFALLTGVFALASLAALASIPFVLLYIPLYIAICGLGLIIITLSKISKGLNLKTILGIALIITVMNTIILVGLSMMIMAIVAEQVMRNFGWILALLGGMVAISVVLMGLGLLVSLLSVVAIPAILGMFALTAMISAVVLTAAQLIFLQKLDLDKDAIINNVNTVMECATSIMNSLFGSKDAENDINNAGNAKSWFGAFMGIFVGNKVMLKAILSSLVLTMTLISVTMILFIAAELKLLQIEISKLDRGKVLSAVNNILDTSKFIGDSIFGDKYYNTDEDKIATNYSEKKMNWIGRMFSGFGTLLSAISSSAIMISTFMSVSMIWLMAKELSNLQNIQLNKSAIRQNIDDIINTAKQIIDVINAPSDTKIINKKDGLLGKLLDFILPSNMKYTIDAISSMGFVAITMISVGMLSKIAEQLQKIEDLPKLSNIQQNTNIILGSAKNVISSVNDYNFDNKKLANNIKSIRKIKRLLKNIIELVEINVNNIGNIGDNIGSIITILNNIMNSVDNIHDNSTKTKMFEKSISFIKMINRFIKSFDNTIPIYIDSKKYIDFIESINKIVQSITARGVGIFHMRKDNRLYKQLTIISELNKYIVETYNMTNEIDMGAFKLNDEFYISFIKSMNTIMRNLNMKRVGIIKSNRLSKQLKVLSLLTSYIIDNYSNISKISLYTFDTYRESGYGKFMDLLKNIIHDIDIHIRRIKIDNILKKFDKTLIGFSQMNRFIEDFTLPTFKTIDGESYKKFIESINNVMDLIDSEKIKTKDIKRFKSKFEVLNEINKFIEDFTLPTFKTIDGESYKKFIESINMVTDSLKFKRLNDNIEKSIRDRGRIFNTLNKFINDIHTFTPRDFDKEVYIRVINNVEDILSKINGKNKISYKSFNDKLNAVKNAGKVLTGFTHDFLSVNTNDVEKVTENYIKFVDKVDKSKLENLKTTAKVFEKMANFSKTINGNFEGLASTINDKLMPVLEELKQIMNDVPDKLDKGFAGTQNAVYETSANTSRSEESFNRQAQANATATGQTLTEDEVNARAQKMMREQIAEQNHGIEAKLDELIEILSGSLRVQME